MDYIDYMNKYIKYKNKYLEQINEINGGQRQKKRLKNKNKNKNKDYDNSNIIITKRISDMITPREIKPDYIEHLSEPWFSLISLGLKTVEGRKNKGKFMNMKIGDIIQWVNHDFMERTIMTEILDKVKYISFQEYLEMEGLDKCLPGIPDIEHGLSVYFKYFTKEDEARYGVIAIRLKLI